MSSIYTGGTHNATNALWRWDYIELFNPTQNSVAIDGWSVQYADGASGTWTAINLPNHTMDPGKYFLIKMGRTGGSNSRPDFTADLNNTALNMNLNTGKVAIRDNTTALSGTCPLSAGSTGIIDLVGYGTANCFEVAGSASPNHIQVLFRKLGGCVDDDNNSTDLEVITSPAQGPRNSSVAADLANVCYDISLSVTDSPDPIPADGILTYEISVAGGPVTVSDIEVVATLPTNAAVVSVIITGGVNSAHVVVGNTLTATFDSIDSLTTALITVEVLVECDIAPGTILPFSATSTATGDINPANNTATASTTVAAENIPPTVTAYTSSLLLEADSACSAPLPDLTGSVVAFDNCSTTPLLLITQSLTSGTLMPVGQTILDITVRDEAGNDAIVPVTVDVVDVLAPTVTCPDDVNVPADSSFQAQIPDFSVGLSMFDNCTAFGSLIYVQDPPAGTTVGVGVHQVDISVTDASGNTTDCSVDVSVADVTAPTVLLTTTASAVTNVNPIPVTATFSEAVSGLLSSSIIATSATVQNFQQISPTVYTFELVPSFEGALSVFIPGDAADDASSNGNVVSNLLSLTYDGTRPSAVISSPASEPTNVNPIPVTIVFDEPIVSLLETDFVVANATIQNFTSEGGTTFTLNLAATAPTVTITLDLPENVTSDAAGNGNHPATFSRFYSDTLPTVQLVSATSSVTNANPIPVTINFSTDVFGFEASDINVTNGVVQDFTEVNPAQYTINVVPLSQGVVTVSVPGLAAVDGASNPNQASPTFTRTFDSVAPGASLSSGVGTHTTSANFQVTVTFTEAVAALVNGSLSVTNGSATLSSSPNSAVYIFDVTASAEGDVEIVLPASTTSDGAGNSNTVSNTLIVRYDLTRPALTLSTAAANPTNLNPFQVTATFSEDVVGFTLGDIIASNAIVFNFAVVSPSEYTFNVYPSGEGVVTVDVPANAAADPAGNLSTAATTLTRSYDSVGPNVAMSTTLASPTSTALIPVTVVFTEPVTGFDSSDVAVTNGTMSDFTPVSSTVYTFNITATAEGAVTADIPASSAFDAAGNGNFPAPLFQVTYDTVNPTPTIDSVTSDPTAQSPIPVTVSFAEAVTGFNITDLSVGNGTATNFTGSGANYAFEIVPAAQGIVTVSIPAGAANDLAGNASLASATFSRTFSNVRPTVVMSSTESSPTNLAAYPVEATFNKNVSGFTAGDILVTNGTIANFVTVDDATYSFDVLATTDGAVTVNIPENTATDSASNGNLASPTFTFIYDTNSPTVIITSTVSDPTGVTPIPVTFTFSEDVVNFTTADLGLTNGFVNNFSGSGSVYTADITPASNGLVTVALTAGAAEDEAGNPSAAASYSVTFFNVRPTVALQTTAGNNTNLSPIPFTATFSLGVTGFVAGDIVATNALVNNFQTISPTQYSFDLVPQGQGLVTVAVPENVAVAGIEQNLASAVVELTYDSAAPTVVLSSTLSGPTNVSPIPVSAVFNEPVTGLTAGDIIATNATVTNFSGSGDSYSFELVPAGVGAVTAVIPAGVAPDAAGNPNAASNTFNIAFNNIQPTVVMSSLTANPTNSASIAVTVTFSTSVSGFDDSDIVVTNGSATGFAPQSGSVYTFNLVPAADGIVAAVIGAGAGTDGAGNASLASPTFSRTVDRVAPTVVLTSASPNPTRISPIAVTATFSEDVTLFDSTSITRGNANVANFVQVTPSVYTFNLVPIGQGTVTASIPSNGGRDAANNGSTASAQLSRLFDSVAPSSQVTGPNGAVHSLNPMVALNYTASDSGSGFGAVGSGVYLYYRFNNQGVFNLYSVNPYQVTGPTGVINVNTSLIGGDGTYQFYTAGIDSAGNIESAPGGGVGDVTIVFTSDPTLNAESWMHYE